MEKYATDHLIKIFNRYISYEDTINYSQRGLLFRVIEELENRKVKFNTDYTEIIIGD